MNKLIIRVITSAHVFFIAAFSLPNFKRGLWQNFGRLDGLVGSVNHIFRDQANSLWFGTSEGLARYDGKGFSYLSVEDGLVGNNISHIAQTNDNKLWIATTEGLSIYNGKKFKNFNTENGLLDKETIKWIVENKRCGHFTCKLIIEDMIKKKIIERDFTGCFSPQDLQKPKKEYDL